MKYIRLLLVQLALIVGVLLVPGFPALAAEEVKPTLKTKFLTFGDMYWFASHHNKNIEGRTGLWFRRIYLTFDGEMDIYFGRLRFEMSSADSLVAPITADLMMPFVKDAYVGVKFLPEHRLVLGMSASPTWEVIESLWGYRSLEKTPADLMRMGGSRDIGVALLGDLANKVVSYHLMFGNGSDTRSEINRGKKAMLSLGFRPMESLYLELYGDVATGSGTDSWAAQAFAFYGKKGGDRIGLQYVYNDRGPKDALGVGSIFGAVKLGELAEKEFVFVGRYDRVFQPNTQAGAIPYWRLSPDAQINLIVAGIDVGLAKNIRIIPNIEYLFYDNAKAGKTLPNAVVVPRVTFFYEF